MELPRLDGLELLSTTFDSHASFKRFVTSCFRAVANSAELDLPEFKEIDQSSCKQMFSSMSRLILEASKQDAAASEVRSFLEEYPLEDEQTELLLSLYEKSKPRVRGLLARTRFDFTEIVGIDWRLDYFVKSNALHKANQPMFFVTLKVKKPGSAQISDYSFSCSPEELQDFHAKVKDAVTQVDRVLQKANS